LEVAAIGDATVLELAEGDFEYCDVLGEVRAGRQRLKARGLVLAGRWSHPPRQKQPPGAVADRSARVPAQLSERLA
jgi:dihydroorotase